MAELEINVVTEGSDAAGPSENPTLVVSDYSLIHHTDYSSTIIAQNANNASVVSIFSLEGNKPQAMEQNQSISVDLPPTSVPTSTGGSAY